MRFYCEEKEAVLQALDSSKEGLSTSEALKRLEENGKNRLEAAKGKSVIQRFLEQLADPMIIILLIAALISGVLAVMEKEGLTQLSLTDADCKLMKMKNGMDTAFALDENTIFFCFKL